MEYLEFYEYQKEELDKLNSLSESERENMASNGFSNDYIQEESDTKYFAYNAFLEFQGNIEEYVIHKLKEYPIPIFKDLPTDEKDDEYWESYFYNDQRIEEEIYKIEKQLILIVKQIAKNPSTLLVEQKIKVLENMFKGNNKAIEASAEFILEHINNEYLLNIGHTDAWAILSKYKNDLLLKPESVNRRKKEANSPQWLKGSCEKLHNILSTLGIFKKEYLLNEFKNTFMGKPISKVKEIQFAGHIEGSTKVLFFELLVKEEIISKSNQEVLGKLIGKNSTFYKTTKSRLKLVKNISNGKDVTTAIYTALRTTT